jgi:hypothetical protein
MEVIKLIKLLELSKKYLKHIRGRNRQIVILLGAGAACAWDGIGSWEIKEKFINDTTFKTKDGTTIGKFVFDILDKFYVEEKDKANFETFLAVIEEFLNYVIASTTLGKTPYNTSFIPVVLELNEKLQDLLDGKNEVGKRIYSYELFRHYINLIIDEIDEYNKKVLGGKYKEINENLIRFTQYFLDKNYSVKFYTTNYDRLIPQILSRRFKVYEGLYKSSGNYKRFIYDLSRFRQARLSHFNLHGSIFLREITIDGYKRESVYFTKKQPLSISDGRFGNGGNIGEPLFFSPIISGQNKTQRSFNKPFNLGFNAFINDCNNCRALITVGYSFSDPHINSILSTFTSWDKAKFLNITKMERDYNPTNEDANLDALFATPMSKEKEDATWFYDKKYRKRIYKKSFEEFLKDKSNWEWLYP